MKKKLFYRERTWTCGHYKEIEIFPVYQKPGIRRSKCKPSSEIQKQLNDKHSKAHFKRLVHLNFTEGDCVIGLDYTEGCLPDNDDMAKRDAQNWVRRLRCLYKKLGSELKYIIVYERSDEGRPHFHALINDIGIEIKRLQQLWTYGRTEVDSLQFDNSGVVGLSKYYSKGKLFYRRWSGSKNLKQPEPDDKDYKYTNKAIAALKIEDPEEIRKIYGDGYIVNCEIRNNDINRADYINIVIFDYVAFYNEVGKKAYQMIKKDKTTALTPARRVE